MFPEIANSEWLIIGMVALLVFRPQDLPVIMKKVGVWVGKARRMAADFRSAFDDMARASELDQLRKEVESMRANATKAVQSATSPISAIGSSLNETMAEIKSSVSDTGPTPLPPVYDAEPAEPAPKPASKAPARKAAPKAPTEKTGATKPAIAKSEAPKRAPRAKAAKPDVAQ